MLSRVLIFVFSLGSILSLYITWTYDDSYSFLIIPFVLLGASSIVMSPQIDYWWISKFPPKSDPSAKAFIKLHIPNSGALPDIFYHRMELFKRSFDWMPMGFETVPLDISYILSSYSALLTLNRKKFQFKDWQKVVLYQHPFPSHQYPDHFHNCETFAEDGVMLINMEWLMLGFVNPNIALPTGLYMMSEAYLHQFQKKERPNWPIINNEQWSLILEGKPEYLSKGIGLDVFDSTAAGICFYFYFPQKMVQIAPEFYEYCQAHFSIHIPRD